MESIGIFCYVVKVCFQISLNDLDFCSALFDVLRVQGGFRLGHLYLVLDAALFIFLQYLGLDCCCDVMLNK